MRTVKTYMVRKPSDIDEVKCITRANSDRLETVAVVETIILSLAELYSLKAGIGAGLIDYGYFLRCQGV